MIQKDVVDFAGQYFIDDCSLVSIDGTSLFVKEQIESIVVYEDIFSPFISGVLILRDNQDVAGAFGEKFYGISYITLKLGSPDVDESQYISAAFHVTKQSDRVLAGERVQLYAYHFVSIESLPNQKRLSRAMKGNCSTLATTVCKDYLQTGKNVKTTASNNDIKFVSNYWTPTQILTFLAEHAKESEKNSNFLFFENRDGFNFRSFSDLTDRQSPPVIVFKNIDQYGLTEQGKSSVQKSPQLDYETILNIVVDNTYDYVKDFETGMIKSKLYVVDPIRKKYDVKRYNLKENGADSLSMNFDDGLPYVPAVIDASEEVVTFRQQFYNTYETGHPSNLQSLVYRNAQMRKYQCRKIEIEVFGSALYTVGRKVFINLSKIESDPDSNFDMMYSGFYLISAVAHRFAGEKYKCTLELIKDGNYIQ